jgi:hypothetical protein
VEQTERALLDARVDVRPAPQLHHEPHAVPEALEHLRQRLDPLAAEAPAEPATGVETLQLPDRDLSHPSTPGRRPFQPVPVDHDELLV